MKKNFERVFIKVGYQKNHYLIITYSDNHSEYSFIDKRQNIFSFQQKLLLDKIGFSCRIKTVSKKLKHLGSLKENYG
ncbi:MAG: hypothetical protein BWY58_00794 [Chloroflexi bacterium ADurb.Bin344]|nr:MAG: hypothetical protein BWY58_00794 [Chloroflexi bacterium ADurb.Bin344]